MSSTATCFWPEPETLKCFRKKKVSTLHLVLFLSFRPASLPWWFLVKVCWFPVDLINSQTKSFAWWLLSEDVTTFSFDHSTLQACELRYKGPSWKNRTSIYQRNQFIDCTYYLCYTIAKKVVQVCPKKMCNLVPKFYCNHKQKLYLLKQNNLLHRRCVIISWRRQLLVLMLFIIIAFPGVLKFFVCTQYCLPTKSLLMTIPYLSFLLSLK